MLRFVMLGVAWMLSAGGCVQDPAPAKHRGPCPEGTVLVGGRHCVIPNALGDRCPEGFEWDASRRACVFLCPDASVDAEPSPFCPADAGASDAAQ